MGSAPREGDGAAGVVLVPDGPAVAATDLTGECTATVDPPLSNFEDIPDACVKAVWLPSRWWRQTA